MDQHSLANGQFLYLSRFEPQQLVHCSEIRLPNNTLITVIAPGIVLLEPPLPKGKHIVYSCGIHGNETAPIEICSDILDQILQGDIVLSHRLLMVFGNLPAMNSGERFVEENLNRLFCGFHENGTTPERERARQLEEVVSQFFNVAPATDERIHYDLHTAIRDSKNEKFVVMPFLSDGRKQSKKQFGFLASCGIDTFLLSSAPTTTFSYYSSSVHQARSYTVELGKVKPFGQNDMLRFSAAKASLVNLISTEDFAPQAKVSQLLLYKVNQVINRDSTNFSLNFAEDKPNFSDFERGEILATEPSKTYCAQYKGEAIVFPNANVALGQRALLTVIPTQLSDLDD